MKKKTAVLKSLQTNSALETQERGHRLGKKLKPGDVILLIANLGAGKTTFVQGLSKGLGVKDMALSPTFILAQSMQGKIPVHHLDFYRATPKELLEIGIEDYFTGLGEIEKGVVLIEWADRFKKIWPAERLEIRIKILPGRKTREFKFHAVGKRYGDLISKL